MYRSRKKFPIKKFITSTTLLIIFTLLFATTAFAADVQIDAFSATTIPAGLTADSGTPTVSSADGDAVGSILGGERDIVLDYVSGTNSVSLDVNTVTNRLEFAANASTVGNFSVLWDGDDDDASTNAFGLGSVDLTDGGSNDAILIQLTADQVYSFNFVLYEDGSNFSTYSIINATPIQGVKINYLIPFADMVDTGTGADASSVEAIEFSMNGTSELDFTLDLIVATDTSSAQFDMGDLPSPIGASPDYQNTTLANNGAGHRTTGSTIRLGSLLDAEADGQESADADGDGLDEDGVSRDVATSWSSAGTKNLNVTVTGTNGCLFGWIDYHDGTFAAGADGTFDDFGEDVISALEVSAGANVVPITILTDMSNGTVYARFRIVPDPNNDGNCSDVGDVEPTGLLGDGEVEDYQWSFGPTAVQMSSVSAESSSTNSDVSSIFTLMLLMTTIALGYVYREQLGELLAELD